MRPARLRRSTATRRLTATRRPTATRRVTTVALTVFAVLATGLAVTPPATAASPDLFFSEYVEGSGNNKAIEIYNGTGAAVDLSAYTLELYSNGAAAPTASRALTGSLADRDVFVAANSLADPAIQAAADLVVAGGVINWNGDDAIVLRKGGVVVDSFGQVGVDPGTEWGTGLTSTADNTLRRKPTVLQGDTNPADAFDPAPDWDGFAINTLDGLGSHTVSDGGPVTDAAPSVASTNPAAAATDVELNANVRLTFSEAVTLAPGAATITCSGSGAHAASTTGAATTYTLDPATDFAFGDVCTVTVTAGAVTDEDTVDPPDTMAADVSFTFSTLASDPCADAFTPIAEIQGAGATSPKAGQTLDTEGVVVGDFQAPGGLTGFNLQDPTGDNDPLTSEGVFVFGSRAPAVAVGDVVRVRGAVSEFRNQTEITVTTARVCGTAAVPAPTPVVLPEATNGDLERHEGMLVTVPGPLTVQQNFFQGQFGQLTLASGGRVFQPTNQFPAGSPQAIALADENKRRMIFLDDASGTRNPQPVPYLGAQGVPRAGDRVSGVQGVLDEGPVNTSTTSNFDYRVQPTAAPTFTVANPRTAAPEPVGGNLKVAFFNVLNYFTTFTSVDRNARGADNAEEFDRQRTKIFAAMAAIDADVIGLSEIENSGPTAVTDLVDGLNTYVGAPGRYAAVPDPTAGTGTDAIKVAMIYRTSAVEPVGASLSDPAAVNNRPPLAQTFRLLRNGEKVSVIVNHLKSKGGCPASAADPNADQGDGQGCFNPLRVAQAEALLTFVTAVQAAAADPDVLVIGDLNSYGREDPIARLEQGGLTNEIRRLVGPDAYSFVFDGMSGYLDHGLATASADRQVVGATEWHINADEASVRDYDLTFNPPDVFEPNAYRASDHDPVVLGIDLGRCDFRDDAARRLRTLQGDCTTSETVRVPGGWTLDGAGHTIAAYDAAGQHFRGAVVANAGSVANVRNLTVTARGLADVCDADADRLRGILLDGASGSLTGNRVIGINQGASGCQEGTGIEVRNAPFDRVGRPVIVSVRDNTVTGYQKAGIVVNGSVVASVNGNTVRGAGLVDTIAQNGIQAGFGAIAVISGNTVADNFYSGPDTACGVLLFQATAATQLLNRFSGNEQNVCTVRRSAAGVRAVS